MPDKKEFPSRSQRRQLLEQLKEANNDPAIAADGQFKLYLEAMERLDAELERLSAPQKENGVPKALTKAETEKLSGMMRDTAVLGEEYLAYNSLRDGAIKQGIPQVVDKLHHLMAKDYEALAEYDEKQPRSLPELQESTRTLTVDLRGKKLSTVGNMQNSRIPMTVADSTGRKRRGFFTKATYFEPKKDFQKLIDKAKAACTTNEQRAALDGFLSAYRNRRAGSKTFSGSKIDAKTGDAYMLGRLVMELDDQFGDFPKLSTDQTKAVLAMGGIGPELLPKEALKVMQQGLTELKNKVSLDINGERLEIEEGTRLDNRNTAMSAVAGLLGCSDAVCKSENMRFIGEDGKVTEGTFMEYAHGTDLYKNRKLFRHVSANAFQNEENRKKVFRQIADVQVLDYICMNEDRHPGNMMYDIDDNGQLRGIQCFDNDSSFGRSSGSKLKAAQLKVVTESMAKRLQGITPKMLKFALRGRGLSEEEMNAAGKRLTKIKNAIKDGQIATVKDEDLGKKQMRHMLPTGKGSNLFSQVDDFFGKIANMYRDPDVPFSPMPKQEDPKLREVGTTDRVFTVGGLTDSLSRVADRVEDRITGDKIDNLRNKLRGSSEKYDKMVQAAKEANALYKKLTEETPEKDLRKLVAEDPKVMAQVTGVFEQVRLTAEDYLWYKTRQRKADSPETIKAKNEYEQGHIDLAMDLKKAADAFFTQSRSRTGSKEESEALQANLARRELERAKENPQPGPEPAPVL